MKKLSLAILCACFALLPAFAADIQVTAPAAGASWKIGTTQTVQWTFSGLPATTKVHILLWQGGTNLGKIAKQHRHRQQRPGQLQLERGRCPGRPARRGRFRLLHQGQDRGRRLRLGVSGTFSLTSGSTISGPQASQLEHNYELVPKKTKPDMPGVNGAQVQDDPGHRAPRQETPWTRPPLAHPLEVHQRSQGDTSPSTLLRDGQPARSLGGSITDPG